MSEEEKYYHQVCEAIDGSIKSQMFGKPCYKLNKKAFCCFFENEMVFKLSGDAHQKAFSLDGSKLFDPSGKGRAMKAWVQLPYIYKDQWEIFAKASAKFIRSTT